MELEIHKNTNYPDTVKTLYEIYDFIGKLTLDQLAGGATIDVSIKTKLANNHETHMDRTRN